MSCEHKVNAADELCPIISKSYISDKFVDITVSAPEIAKKVTSPGQFLHIRCGSFTLRRPISICDINGSKIRIIFEVKGEGTEWLASQKIGDILDVLGPLGNGFQNISGAENAVILGGGIGTPPMLGVCKAVNPGTATVLLGCKTAAASMLIRDFKELGANVRIATDDGSLGICGFVTQLLKQRLEQKEASVILACGPNPMLRAAAKMAEQYKIPCFVSMEERMGCGIGACLVCACKTKKANGDEAYAHVCIDGPVFDSREVVWG